jgi:DNA-binding transcriptional ArsR family regulator
VTVGAGSDRDDGDIYVARVAPTMTDRDARGNDDTGVEELLKGPVDVIHEYDAAVGSLGGRIDEEGERVRNRVSEAVGAFGEGVNDLATNLLGTDARAGVYAALRRTGGATAGEVADETGLPDRAVEDALSALVSEGFVRRTGGRSGRTRGARQGGSGARRRLDT